VTDRRQTDHNTEKCVAVVGTACAARAILPKKLEVSCSVVIYHVFFYCRLMVPLIN